MLAIDTGAPGWVRWFFVVAALFGLVAIGPALSTGVMSGITPPPGAAENPLPAKIVLGTAFAIQFLFLLIAVNPVRFRKLMPIGIVEKASAVLLAPLILLGGGQIAGIGWVAPIVDGLLGIVMFIAWRRTPAAWSGFAQKRKMVMTQQAMMVVLPLVVIYGLFWWWWSAPQKPLTAAEVEEFIADLRKHSSNPDDEHMLAAVRVFSANDDGKPFLMHNSIKYREKAMYPPGYNYNDVAIDADRRYGKLIVPELLKRGCLPVFIARRVGTFVEPDDHIPWQVVAMVRYRSRRDFLHFAVEITRKKISVHKWAAIDQTLIFPVKPLVSFITVRLLVAAVLTIVGLALV